MNNMVEFIVVSKNSYIVKNTVAVEKRITDMITSISEGIKYETVIEDTLFRSMFSRHISSLFIRDMSDVIIKQEFVNITAQLSNGSKIVMSAGVIITDTNKTYLNGVLNI